MIEPYNILVIGPPQSGKSTLIKSLLYYFSNKKIDIPVSFMEIQIKSLMDTNLDDYNLILFTVDNFSKNVFEAFIKLNYLIKIEQGLGHNLKLFLIHLFKNELIILPTYRFKILYEIKTNVAIYNGNLDHLVNEIIYHCSKNKSKL